MFTDHDYLVVDKIAIYEKNGRISQSIVLKVPETKEKFFFSVNRKIDLSGFKRLDRVEVVLQLSKKGNLLAPSFCIKDIRHVILENEVLQNAK